MIAEVLVALVLGAVVYALFRREKQEVLQTEDGWWGEGDPPQVAEDDSIRPFKVETSDMEIEDLQRRIDQTRPFPSLEDSKFNYGFNSNYLQKVVSYWRNEFDWKKQVAKLNKYPHFKTKIEGIDVHFVHVRPHGLPEGQTAIPLLMVHGWPGSFYEFYRILPLLTEPTDPDSIVFEVICPSLPGYAFSEAPHKKGFDSVCAARVFHKLMKRLGFSRFYTQGGDWGTLVTTNMGQLEPQTIKGVHLNFAPLAPPSPVMALHVMLGRWFPTLFGFMAHDLRRLYPFMDKVVGELMKESGYMHIQATKPDTAGRGLNDSPVGLAAYILEKFSTWTEFEHRNMEDGGLERKFSLEDLLTNVMIYWTTGSIISSMRFYKENLSEGLNQKHSKLSLYVPTGVASFPNELVHIPKVWAKRKCPKLISYTPMARGGHFAAMEEPELLATDIKRFVKQLEKSAP